jgi:hypothetical protein
MMHRFRELIWLLTVAMAGLGGYLIYDSLAYSALSDDFLVISGACCCAVAAILFYQLFLHGRDPREPNEE